MKTVRTHTPPGRKRRAVTLETTPKPVKLNYTKEKWEELKRKARENAWRGTYDISHEVAW